MMNKDAYREFYNIVYHLTISPESVVMKKGYPKVPIDIVSIGRFGRPITDHAKWIRIYSILRDNFVREENQCSYLFTDKHVFFAVEEDAHLFRSLLLIM